MPHYAADVPPVTAHLQDLGKRLSNEIALRRAARVAVVVPVMLVALSLVPWLENVELFGAFACLVMLLFADFGGPLRGRFLAYLATTATGIPILIGGILLGQTIAGAAIVMFVVAMALGLAAVLRGRLAAAQSTLLLATVLAVTSASPADLVPAVAAWTIGGLTAAVTAVVLWPARPSRGLAGSLSKIYVTAAAAIRARWVARDAESVTASLAEFDEYLRDLRDRYDGNLLRPAGLTTNDRSLAQLVDLATRLRGYLNWRDLTANDAEPQPSLASADSALAGIIANELDRVSEDLRSGKTTVSPERIRVARDAHLDKVLDWSDAHRGDLPGRTIRRHLDDAFPLRLSSISTELASASLAADAGFRDRTLDWELDPAREGIGERLTRNLSWESPWFRNALRAAIALSISVGVAKALGLEHSFWIVLGTLTALRFDALGTGRTALQALFGTTVGVTLGAALIVLIGDNTAAWWALLPIALFACAFTPGTFSLATGQAGFSLAVIVLFSLMFPATLATAELRLLDVAIGLAVSLLISAVMWPRGVVATLHRRMTEAMTAASDHLLMAIDYIVGGAVDLHMLEDSNLRAARALDRAEEAYDLSLAQRPPKTVPMQKWFRVALAANHINVAAHILPGVEYAVTQRGGSRVFPLELTGSVLETSHEVRDGLRGITKAWDDQMLTGEMTQDDLVLDPVPQTPMPDVRSDKSVAQLRAAIDRWLDQPSDWQGTGQDPRPAVVVWTADWNVFISWNARLLTETLSGSAPAPTR